MVCLREVKEGSGDLYGADLMEERNASCVHVLSCKTLEKMAEKARERVSDYAVTEYSYDANGNVVKVVLPEGGIISYTYDADDRLLSERHTEPKGEIDNQILYTYDKADNLICKTDYQGNKTAYQYDLDDQRIEESYPDGGKQRFVYDKNGNLIKRFTPNQMSLPSKTQFWQYRYDLLDRPVTVYTPDGSVQTSLVYDAKGNVIQTKDASGNGVTLTYDLKGQRLSAVTATGVTQKYHYNALGGNTGVTDTLGNTTKFDLDAWGRIRAVLKADGSREAYEYDHMGNMVRSTDANGFCVQYHYDVRGNMTARIDPSGARESFEYDKENRQTGHTDRNGSRIRTDYNMYGSITRRVAYKADSEKTKNAGIGQVTESYGYLPDGKLSYAISNGMRYDYTYDCMGRLIRKTASGRTLIENTYDFNGNRIRLVDITGKECNYRYDLLDRIESISGNQKEYVTYQYNDDGTLKRMVVGGNLVTEYTYDADKNVAGQRTYVENSWEKGTALLSGGSLQAEYERRQQQKEALAAKAARRYRYLQNTGQVGTGNDDLAGDGSLDNLSLGALLGNANVIVNNTYTYDLLGHMTSKETLSGLTEYTYDKLGQITRAATSGRLEEFQYDPAGNRIGRRLTDHEEEIHEKFLYDSQNRMLQRDIYKNAVTKENLIERYLFEYDAQGSMVSETYQPFEKNRGTNCGMNAGVESGISQTVRTFSYDALNRLQEVKKEEKILQRNTYDAEGLRAEMEENGRLIKFIFDGDKVIAESDTTQGMKRYIRGYKLVSSECEQAKTYYHYTSDHLGSITDVVAETGEVHNHYEYDVFGNHTVCQEQVENRFGFAGEMLDPAINLYYLRARFYNPVIGRFIQEDNYLGDGLNLYEYCHNNPVAYVDPSGNKAISLCPNAENKAGADGDGKSGTPSGYYQDANGRWHRPNGQFASNAEIGLPNKTTKTSNGTRGGRLGNGDTRAQNKLIADYLKSKGYIIIGGGTYRPEEYLPGPNGTHKGSNYIDVTAKKGNIIIRINTVDIDSNGKPTQRELDAASSINQKTGGQIILIPKGAGLGDLEKILFGNN